MRVSGDTLALATVVGTAVVGLWLVVRFPALAPRAIRGAIVHVALAFAAAYFLAPSLSGLVEGVSPMAAFLAVAIPVLVYVFAAAAWLLLAIQRLLVGGYR
jgi:hypothetical protein